MGVWDLMCIAADISTCAEELHLAPPYVTRAKVDISNVSSAAGNKSQRLSGERQPAVSPGQEMATDPE